MKRTEPLPAGAFDRVSLAPTVLLVEDDGDLRRLLSRGLQRNGLTVLEASDGLQALARLSESSPAVDVVVSDVLMPGLTGPQMLEGLRSLRPGLRCLFTSGGVEQELLMGAAGVAFLPKPFTVADLVSRVRALVDER